MREFRDTEGNTWHAEIISHGRASDYLSPKVHRPIVQFTSPNRGLPRRYAPLPPAMGDTLDGLDEETLIQILLRARVH
jgi:hypothetical protein